MGLTYGSDRWRPKRKSQRDKLFDRAQGANQRAARRELLTSVKTYSPKSNLPIAPTHKDIPSVGPSTEPLTPPPKRYNGEMLEREQAAQKQAQIKAKRVAPAYSKGSYQYITDETNLHELGKKI